MTSHTNNRELQGARLYRPLHECDPWELHREARHAIGDARGEWCRGQTYAARGYYLLAVERRDAGNVALVVGLDALLRWLATC